jgi:hypothetical protein
VRVKKAVAVQKNKNGENYEDPTASLPVAGILL